METVRPCGCKGIRSCLLCESQYGISKPDLKGELQKHPSFVFCPNCGKAWPGWDMNLCRDHPDHQGVPIDFPGVYIQLQFLSDKEASSLLSSLDNLPWEASQSGRRKQNFGPKCNFKRQKLRVGDFHGFPACTRFVQTKFHEVPLLRNFRTIEQCSLEYDPERGASIDPHVDDCWIWGERIVTVNVLGDSVLTMTRYRGGTNKYNLENIREYSTNTYEELFVKKLNENQVENLGEDIVVRLPMPQGSLMILYGAARYAWEHSVLREDVKSRRVCLAYREFTPPYDNESHANDEVREILRRSSIFS